jgi:hypothetical protein
MISDKKRIAYVPLDDRPCNLKFPLKLGSAAGAEIYVPPMELLGHFKTPGDCEGTISWLEGISPDVDCIVASAEMLSFGGLVSSRRPEAASEEAVERLRVFERLKKKNPAVKIYSFSVIMRHSPNEVISKEKLPSYLKTRVRNAAVNKKMVELTSNGLVDFLIIGQDDASRHGPHERERKAINELILKAAVGGRAMTLCGADEIGMMLVSRAAFGGRAPRVHVIYSDGKGVDAVPLYEDRPLADTVGDHVNALGGELVEERDASDILLFVNNFLGGNADLFLGGRVSETGNYKPFIDDIKRGLGAGKTVAVADVAFVNGADPGFMDELLKNVQIEKLSSFSAWNTASNSIGSSLSLALLKFFTKGGRELLPLLSERFIDDYLYQTELRQRVKKDLEGRGVSPFDLGEHYPPVDWVVKKELGDLATAFLARHFKKLGKGDLKVNISLPWSRIFEVDVDVI